MLDVVNPIESRGVCELIYSTSIGEECSEAISGKLYVTILAALFGYALTLIFRSHFLVGFIKFVEGKR